jgi:hypothetical protein
MADYTIKFSDGLTIAALVLGPLLAVGATRLVDGWREKRNKRTELFKILMRTRGVRLSPEHVGALNLVEIEFYKEQKVLDALEKYFQHLNDDSAKPNWAQKSVHLFTKLLSEMARSLGYEIEQLQILTGGYAPQGWETTETRQTKIQEKLLALLEGKSSLPVVSANISAPSTSQITPGFPPSP